MSDFQVTDIPSMMYANHWPKAAYLLERWFEGHSNNNAKKGCPLFNYITMDWILSFDRANAQYNKIFSKKVWATSNAKEQISNVLKRRGKLKPNQCTTYDRSDFDLQRNHTDQIQFMTVGDSTLEMLFNPIDHLTAALGRFVFYIVAFGSIAYLRDNQKINRTNKDAYEFCIKEIGVYVRDPFDFNDPPGKDQELGNWDKSDNSVGRTRFNGGQNIYNSNFRKWRQENNKGGDYMIYSDMKYKELTQPHKIIITS